MICFGYVKFPLHIGQVRRIFSREGQRLQTQRIGEREDCKIIQLIYLVATAKLVTMTKYWPAFAVVYAVVVYSLTSVLASGMDVAIHVKTLTLVSFVLAMVYYWIVRLLEDSIFLWFLVVVFGAFAVSFGPGFVI
jgi:hypothetical protein